MNIEYTIYFLELQGRLSFRKDFNMKEYKVNSEEKERLFEAILSLEDKKECYQFFEDLCTIKELEAMAQRLAVAKSLKEKKTYNEIESETNASTATISRVNRCLLYGAGGYELVLTRLKK